MTPPTASPKHVTVEVQVEPRDLFLSILFANRVIIAGGLAIAAMVPVLISTAIGVTGGGGPILPRAFRLYAHPAWLLLLIGFVILFPGYFWIGAKRAATKDPVISRGTTVSIGDTGYVSENELVEERVSWSAFSGAVETAGVFIMSRVSGHVHVVPKLCFTSDRDIDRCRSIIAENIEDARLQG